MIAEETSTVGVSLESLQKQLDALAARVAELETEVEHEHEDIEMLKSATQEDHKRIEKLNAGAPVGPPPPTVSPVGL